MRQSAVRTALPASKQSIETSTGLARETSSGTEHLQFSGVNGSKLNVNGEPGTSLPDHFILKVYKSCFFGIKLTS